MSEKRIDDAMDDLRKVAELEPIVDGIEKVAGHVTKVENRVNKAIEDQNEKIEKGLKATDEKMEKGFNNVVDRLEDFSKRFSFTNRMSFAQDDMSALKSAVPERFKKNLGMYAALQTGAPDSMFRKEEFAAATHAWLNVATKLQLRKYDNEREQNLKDLEALNGAFDNVAKTALGGLTDNLGGYSVPNIVGSEVFKIIRDASDIYGKARQLVMTSDTLSYPDEATAVTINWSNTDGTTLTAGEPTFGVKTLNARKLIGRATFSLELLDDSNVAILPFLQSCFAEKMGGELDFQAIEGAGTPFTGVLNATSVNDCARTNGTNGVVLNYSTTASTKASLVQLFTKGAERFTRDQGVFVCGPGVYAQIIGLVDTNGQPVVRLGTVEGQPNNTLFGRPIIVSNRIPATTIGAGTVSVGGLYFGPMAALMFGVRTGFRWDVSDQVSWATYQADARMVGRFGFVVGIPTAWAKQTGIII